MLKFRVIFTSLLFLLLLGMNSNARASVNEEEVIDNSADDNQSEKESNHEESGAVFTELDFFGAFSLVNIQLQWRDLTGDVSEEESNSEDEWNPKELFVDATELFTSGASTDILPTPAFISTENFFVPLSVSRASEENKGIDNNLSEQNVRTITYIQNSGTYPKS